MDASGHHTGQVDKLIEVTREMNGVEVSHQSRAQPRQRRSYLKFLVALVSLLLLVIVLLTGLVVYLVIFSPLCNLDAPSSSHTECVKQLPRSCCQETCEIFTAHKSADYSVYGWLKFLEVPGQNVTLFQTFSGQQRIISIQNANKKEISFHHQVKLAEGVKIYITLQFSCNESLFKIHEV